MLSARGNIAKILDYSADLYPGKSFTFLLMLFNTRLLYSLFILSILHIVRTLAPAAFTYLLCKYIIKLVSAHYTKCHAPRSDVSSPDSSDTTGLDACITSRTLLTANGPGLTITIDLPPRIVSASNPPSCPDNPTLPASDYLEPCNESEIKFLDMQSIERGALVTLLEPSSRNAVYIEKEQDIIDEIIELYSSLTDQDRDMINSSAPIPISYFDFPDPPLEIPEKYRTNRSEYLFMVPI